jgi:hypothetical protein
MIDASQDRPFLLLEKCSMRARVHEREASRDPRRVRRAPAACVGRRGLADELTKSGAEGAEAPEANSEADLGDGEPCVSQELLGALDAAPQEVLVRRLAEGLLEAADEVRSRRVRFAGQGGNVERLGVGAVDEILRAAEMDVDRDRVAHPPERLEQLPSLAADK